MTVAAARPTREFLELVPRDFARSHLVISTGLEDGAERLAVAPTTSVAAVHNVAVRLGRLVRTSESDGERIAQIIDDAYGQRELDEDEVDQLTGEATLEAQLADADRDLLSSTGCSLTP